MISRHTIREMADRIRERFRPEKIVLFGSYARGDATEASDVDLLVILRTDLAKPKRSAPMYSLLRDYPCGKDIVVYRPDEVAEYQHLPTSLIHRALAEGVVLHEGSSRVYPGLVPQGSAPLLEVHS
ncbi:MAG TPA: nucleotidyltransferase domain-containing protein [Planctomycetota bacterium]|nr:nucleotidyltransferase domain-containing protein [Planctomycetota bacterium]